MIVSKLSKQFFMYSLSAYLILSGGLAMAQGGSGTPPQITNTGTAPVSYQEDTEPATLIGTALIEDSDSQNMSLATFRFGSSYDPAKDELVFSETTNIKAHFDRNTGILRLLAYPATRGASLSLMQAAIRSVAYRTISNDPGTRSVNVSITVTDAQGNRSQPVSKTVNILPVNDPPRISSEKTAPIEVDVNKDYQVFNDLQISDPDNSVFSRAVLEIAEGYEQDRLSIRGSTAGFSVRQEARSITIEGTADAKEYIKLLENIYYRHDPFFGREPGIRKINLTITDNSASTSEPLSRFFIVQPIFSRLNIPPALKDFDIKTSEGEAYFFTAEDFRKSFNDLDDDILVGITIESLPENGTLLLGNTEINNQFILDNTLIRTNQIGQLRYVPNPLFNGNDYFVWNARDQNNFAANPADVFVEVESVNQAPNLSLPASADVEEDTPTSINDISLDDPDRNELRISVSAEHGSLLLPAPVVERNLVSFLSGTNNGEQVIVFTGPAALSAFALSGLIYAPDNNYVGSDVIEIEVEDNEGGEDSGTININVLIINDAPELLNLEGTPLSYTENAAPIQITSSLTVSDEEGNQIKSATVSISEGYVAEEDELSFVAAGNISGTFAEGVLSLTGNASTAQYQSVLRSVKYANSSEDPVSEPRIISFHATDVEDAQSETVSRTLNVVAVNDAPVLANLEDFPLGFSPNGEVIVTNEITIADADNENLVSATIFFDEDEFDDDEDLLEFTDTENITASWDEDEGVLTLSGTATVAAYQEAIRSVTYRNLDDEAGEDSKIIRIRVNDGQTESNTLERELVPNQPPLVSSFDRTTEEEQPITFAASNFPFEDPDDFPEDGELISIIITRLPGKGVLTLGEDTLRDACLNQTIPAEQIGQLQYLPLKDSTGTDSFGWNASDGASFARNPAQVNINITPLPDPPSPENFSVEATEDEAYGFTAAQFAAASTDPDGDALAAVIIRSTPANGTLLLNNIALPANSQLSLAELDNLLYRPADNFTGDDSFNWAASDGDNISSQTAEVRITVAGVNDAPIVSSFTRAVNEGAIYPFETEDFSQNYLDVENTPLSLIRIVSLPAEGTLFLDKNPISVGAEISVDDISDLDYQPAEEFGGGIVSFQWNGSDGALFAVNPARVNIIIGVGVTDFSIIANEDEEYRFSRLQFANNYGNPNATLQSIRIEELPENGSLLLNEETVELNQEIPATEIGQLSYLPADNFFGEDSLSWNASGGEGFAAETAKVRITVNPVNDAPQISQIADQTLVAGSTSEPVTFEVSDQESAAGELSISIFSSDASIIPADQINISGSGNSRNLSLTALEDTQGTVTVTLVVSDGEKQSEMQFEVLVAPYAIGIDTESELNICEGESGTLQLSIDGGQSPYELQAICETGECDGTVDLTEGILTFKPTVSNMYFISLVDANGIRSNVDTIQVNVEDCTNLALNIPTAFTPNGDQVNDRWEIENIEYSNTVVVEVFNRYGLQVFISEGYTQPWDGTYENSLLPAGTYYYVINVDSGTQIYNGSVSILR